MTFNGRDLKIVHTFYFFDQPILYLAKLNRRYFLGSVGCDDNHLLSEISSKQASDVLNNKTTFYEIQRQSRIRSFIMDGITLETRYFGSIYDKWSDYTVRRRVRAKYSPLRHTLRTTKEYNQR